MYEFNLGIRFQNIVEKYSKKSAIRSSTNKSGLVDYVNLNNKSNQIANFLLDQKITKKDVVCISSKKVINTYASMIACLKIGSPYVILDYQSPIGRLKKIIDKSNPKALLVHNEIEKRINRLYPENIEKKKIYNIDDLDKRIKIYDKNNLLITEKIRGDNPAYIMFTSGSTGFPKGAVISHSNVLNFISWGISEYKVSCNSVFSNLNPLYFDNSVFDFYLSLFSGASLVPFSKEDILNPKILLTRINNLKCTILFSVPSMFIYMDTMKIFNNNLDSVKYIIFGGEGYHKKKLKSLFDKIGHQADLYNVYGPTECTCICSSYKISSIDFNNLNGLPPLGKINDNFSFMIVNKLNEIVEVGESGQLCLMGPNIGKGYFNDHDLTNQSFIQNPFNKNYMEIIYKSGDIVSKNKEDGKLYFHGRLDNQIKHMGYRIELEEIEFGLNSIPYVNESAVLHSKTEGLSRIFAVISCSKKLNEMKLKTDLKTLLPDYMIPSVYYFQKRLPKNRNGKLDREKLFKKFILKEK